MLRLARECLYQRLRPWRAAPLALLWVAAVTISPAGSTRFPSPVERAADGVTAATLHSYVEHLADDAMAGRGIGQPGNRRAEMYVADVLRREDVPSAIDGSYFQPVQVYRPSLGTHAAFSAAVGADRVLELRPGPDFYPLLESSNSPVSARLVLAGRGLSARGNQHDDYRNVNARGAIVIARDSGGDRIADKIDAAAAHGAAGLLVIQPHLSELSEVWPDHPSAREASFRLYSDFRRARLPVAAISQSAAEPLIRALAAHPVSATLTPDLIADPIAVDNVIACIDGREHASGEMVVIGAHLDHDGVDDDGQIYNGADDNASGTAAVLAIASAFVRAAAAGERPRRMVVFALWNAEEKGSLGAEAFVEAPRPSRRIVANINLDMVGRDEDVPDPGDPRYAGLSRTSAAENTNAVHLLGYTYSPDLARIVVSANDGIRLAIKQDYDRNAQNLVRRSDDWPFLAHGIPAVFLTTGLHPDYHTPSDDTERLNFTKLERITKLAFRAAWLAAEGRPPRFQEQHG